MDRAEAKKMAIEKTRELANEFIKFIKITGEIDDTTVGVYDKPKDWYDIWGLIDGLNETTRDKVCNILGLLGYTSVGHMFKRYLAEVLLIAHNPKAKFNEYEFNKIADYWQGKILPVGENKDILDRLVRCSNIFLETVLPAVEACVNENATKFVKENILSEIFKRFDDWSRDTIKEPVQSCEFWLDITRHIRHSGNTKTKKKKFEKAVQEYLTSKRGCGFTRSNSCSDLEIFS